MKPKRKARTFRCINDFMKVMFPQLWRQQKAARGREATSEEARQEFNKAIRDAFTKRKE